MIRERVVSFLQCPLFQETRQYMLGNDIMQRAQRDGRGETRIDGRLHAALMASRVRIVWCEPTVHFGTRTSTNKTLDTIWLRLTGRD